jgi:hypothetical protein
VIQRREGIGFESCGILVRFELGFGLPEPSRVFFVEIHRPPYIRFWSDFSHHHPPIIFCSFTLPFFIADFNERSGGETPRLSIGDTRQGKTRQIIVYSLKPSFSNFYFLQSL